MSEGDDRVPILPESGDTEIAGGCLCGGVRYVLHRPPGRTALCHCTHCQKQSGSAFSVNIVVATADLSVQGALAVYVDTADSGRKLERQFCASCGSPIFSRPVDSPDVSYLKAGTLDDTAIVRPGAQVWVGSAQPWLPLDEALPMFPRGSQG